VIRSKLERRTLVSLKTTDDSCILLSVRRPNHVLNLLRHENKLPPLRDCSIQESRTSHQPRYASDFAQHENCKEVDLLDRFSLAPHGSRDDRLAVVYLRSDEH